MRGPRFLFSDKTSGTEENGRAILVAEVAPPKMVCRAKCQEFTNRNALNYSPRAIPLARPTLFKVNPQLQQTSLKTRATAPQIGGPRQASTNVCRSRNIFRQPKRCGTGRFHRRRCKQDRLLGGCVTIGLVSTGSWLQTVPSARRSWMPVFPIVSL